MNHTPQDIHRRLTEIDAPPWAYDGRDLRCAITSGTHTIAACGVRHQPDPLTSFDRIQDAPTVQDDINARFIADAPQLIQSLLGALEQYIELAEAISTLREEGADYDAELEDLDALTRTINNGKRLHS